MNNDFRLYCEKILNKGKQIINNIQINIYNSKQKSQNYFNVLDISTKEIKNEIDNNLFIITNDYNNIFNLKKNLFDNFKEKCIKYCEIIKNISEYINDILKLVNDFQNNINDVLNYDFAPPNINSFMDSTDVELNISNKFYNSFLDEEKEKEKIINSTIIMCPICNNNKEIKFLCQHCNQLFCEKCFDKIKDNDNNHKIELIKDEADKKLFLNSIEFIIKKILVMTNYILSQEKIKLMNNNNNLNLTIKYIIRKFKYPFINNFNDFESNLVFLRNINLILINELNVINLNINDFQISGIQKELIYLIKNIFKDDKINLIREELEKIDNNFYSDSDYDFIDE